MYYKGFLVAIISIFSFTAALSQSVGEQAWAEYQVTYPFATNYKLEYRARYRTNFDASKWRAVDNRLTLEGAILPRVDVSVATQLTYINQTEDYNTLEIRPILGMRYNISPNRRFFVRFFARYELRYVEDLESDEWTHTNRLRLRPELRLPLNKKTYYEDKLWYGIFDVEWFASIDKDQTERFANRLRSRLGLGYRLSYIFRFELIYILQQSKNTIGEDFNRSDNIFNFKVKHYLRKGQKE